MNDERVQPLVRMVSRIHVLEEARHVTFARDELEKSLAGISTRELKWHQFVASQAAYVTMRSLVNPRVYAAVGLDPREARTQALANPHYQATMAWMGERVLAFLDEQGLVSAAQKPVWKRLLLMPDDA